MAWSWPDGTVVIRGLAHGVHRLHWRDGETEHHRDFVIDGSRAIVDVGDLLCVARK